MCCNAPYKWSDFAYVWPWLSILMATVILFQYFVASGTPAGSSAGLLSTVHGHWAVAPGGQILFIAFWIYSPSIPFFVFLLLECFLLYLLNPNFLNFPHHTAVYNSVIIPWLPSYPGLSFLLIFDYLPFEFLMEYFHQRLNSVSGCVVDCYCSPCNGCDIYLSILYVVSLSVVHFILYGLCQWCMKCMVAF